MSSIAAAPSTPTSEWLTNSYQSLARTLQSGLGLTAIVSALGRVLSAPVCLVDTRGSILASAPSRAVWNVAEILAWDQSCTDTRRVVVPLNLGGDTVALLCAETAPDPARICSFAADLIVTELSREQARLEGRRELAAQILEDFLRARLADHDAAERLKAIGVDTAKEHRILVGQVRTSEKRLRSIPWNLHTLVEAGRDPYVRAVVDGQVVLVVPASTPVQALASVTFAHLSRLGTDARLGIGGTYPGIAGLRLSYFHARAAATSRPGITANMAMNLGSILMLANLDLPLGSLSREALRPLLDYDLDNGGELVHTLATYLRLDCANLKTASQLFIHRNTLRYRLDQIEALTKRSLSSFQDRMHFWVAIIGLEPGVGMTLGEEDLETPGDGLPPAWQGELGSREGNGR